MKPVTIYIPPAANDDRYEPAHYGKALLGAFFAGLVIGMFWSVL